MTIYRQPPGSEVRRLLTESDLPTSDLTPEHLNHFFGCGPRQKPQGVVGLQIYGSVALLRSLAVAAGTRRRGCGKALVAEAERYAQACGVERLYLLTITAEKFFERLGYTHAVRETAPEAIRSTHEFLGLCPSTSAFMVKELAANPPLNPPAAG